MRSKEELGNYLDFGERTNEAYRTYASLYLDFVDDNPEKFFTRMKDVAPLNVVKDDCFQAYLDAAVEIAKTVASSGYFSSFEDMYKEYPLLREASDRLESEFYEKEM